MPSNGTSTNDTVELEKRLDADSRNTPVNNRYVSTTDSDASIVRHAGGKAKLRYKTHRAVDGLREVITTVKVTPGIVDDGHEMGTLIEGHEKNTEATTTTVVADSKYGTKENLLLCHDKDIQAHVPTMKAITGTTSSREGIFPEERFVYHKETDTYTCPAGKVLKKRSVHEDKQNIEYGASKKDCRACSLRSGCTRSKGFRSVQRHVRQEDLDHMLALTKTYAAKTDLKTRQQLMERSYARSTRFGFDRARWRGLWRVAIQEYLVSAIQNIETLIRYGRKPTKGVRTAPFTTLGRAVWAYIKSYLSSLRRRAQMSDLTDLGLPKWPGHMIPGYKARSGNRPSILDLFFYPPDVAAAKAFDLTPELQISPDLPVVQDAETIDHRDFSPRLLYDLIRIHVKVRGMANSQHQRIDPREGLRQVLPDLQILQFLLVPEKNALRFPRVNLLVLELPPPVHVGVVNPDLGTHFTQAPHKDLRPAVARVSHVLPV